MARLEKMKLFKLVIMPLKLFNGRLWYSFVVRASGDGVEGINETVLVVFSGNGQRHEKKTNPSQDASF